MPEIESAKKTLESAGAVFKGEYRCRDLIFTLEKNLILRQKGESILRIILIRTLDLTLNSLVLDGNMIWEKNRLTWRE